MDACDHDFSCERPPTCVSRPHGPHHAEFAWTASPEKGARQKVSREIRAARNQRKRIIPEWMALYRQTSSPKSSFVRDPLMRSMDGAPALGDLPQPQNASPAFAPTLADVGPWALSNLDKMVPEAPHCRLFASVEEVASRCRRKTRRALQ